VTAGRTQMIPSCFIRCYVVAAVGSVGLGWVDVRLDVGGKPHSTHALTDGQPGNVMHLAPKNRTGGFKSGLYTERLRSAETFPLFITDLFAV